MRPLSSADTDQLIENLLADEKNEIVRAGAEENLEESYRVLIRAVSTVNADAADDIDGEKQVLGSWPLSVSYWNGDAHRSNTGSPVIRFPSLQCMSVLISSREQLQQTMIRTPILIR